MKPLIFLFILIVSIEAQAACKCNCNPADRSICASLYDLDRPCGAICPSSGQTPGFAPMITACPVKRAVNRLTGANEWVSDCALH